MAVLLGAAAAVTAGILMSGEDTVSKTYELGPPPDCTGDACTFADIETTAEVTDTDYIIVGAAVAGAMWLYGLVDGIRAAKRSQTTVEEAPAPSTGFSLQLAPPDGLRLGRGGTGEFTLIRIRL
jgi:hypothetical protein